MVAWQKALGSFHDGIFFQGLDDVVFGGSKRKISCVVLRCKIWKMILFSLGSEVIAEDVDVADP